ncbi:MAG: sulfatase-like hydrolase/transferase [Flaviramulus sp.]|nr:sulfatase-like hydrolase/transferase [Flaviramulus sp.]
MKLTFYIFLFSIIFFSCSKSEEAQEIIEQEETNIDITKPNILLVIADDMGLDATPGYDLVNSIKPQMPNLEAMISNGIKFTNTWSYSVCSPTRASILTGKYGFRTNVLRAGDVLSTSEISLQKYLDNQNSGYSHKLIGKWHLSSDINHPNSMGIDDFAGFRNGGVTSYSNWDFIENLQTSNSTEYTTTKFTNLAIDWVANQTQPWFLWLAYNAPHTPFHLPPNNLHSQGSLPSESSAIETNPLPYYLAMIEAMDTEMGRLISTFSQEVKDNTIIIFIGDNGSPRQVAQVYPNGRAKESLYQGGINVPMVVSGKNIERIGAIEDALINTTDLYATIAEIAGLNIAEINDSKSFKSLFKTSNTSIRDYAFSELEDTSGNIDYTIRNNTFKYMSFSSGQEALYNLINDPLESTNLLNNTLTDTENNNKLALIAEVTRLKQ